MSLFFFLRFILINFLLVGWLFYQLLYKRKKWREIKDDAMAVLFFVCVWTGIAYFFTS